MKLFSTLVAIVGLSLFVPNDALAQEMTPVLAHGQTLVVLSASEQKDVEQDMLSASLRVEIEDKDSRVVQDKINKAMAKAVESSKKVKGLDVSTGQYYVYSYDPNPQPIPHSEVGEKSRLIWKGTQTLDIQSKDSQKLLDVVAEIQNDGFAMSGLNYMLSPEATESYKDELMVGALKKIKDKAALITKTLGKSEFDLIEVNIEGTYMPSPMPMLKGMARAEMAMVADAGVSSPVAEPGKSTVSLTVSARVIIK